MIKSTDAVMNQTKVADSKEARKIYGFEQDQNLAADPVIQYMSKEELEKQLKIVQKNMETAAKELDFDKAAQFRDELFALQKLIKDKA